MKGILKVPILVCIAFNAISAKSDARECVPSKNSPSRHHNERVVGGFVARPHSFPYIAYIKTEFSICPTACGGSIMDKRNVITAAHCLNPEEPKNHTIFAGAHNISGILRGTTNIDHLPPEVQGSEIVLRTTVVKPQRVIPHPKYRQANADYDFGIIHLSEDLDFNQYVKPIGLARKGQKFPDNSVATVSGWGDMNWNYTEEAEVLHYTKLRTINRKKCQEIDEMVSKRKKPPNFMDDKLCAGPPGKGVAHGDSGGPMVIDGVLAGVSSFGQGHEKWPSYFSKVSHMADWVEENKYPPQGLDSHFALHF